MNINSNNSRVFIDARPQKNMVQDIGGEMQIRQMLARICGTVLIFKNLKNTLFTRIFYVFLFVHGGGNSSKDMCGLAPWHKRQK